MAIRNVLHLADSPCAGAPGMASYCIDQYSGWSSKIFVNRKILSAGDFSMDYKDSISREEITERAVQADILHFHNCDPMGWNLKKMKPFVLELHSEPAQKDRLLKLYPDKCITIAQKHATLYKYLPVVPNLIPFYDELYQPKEKSRNSVRIVFSPTRKQEPNSYQGTIGKGFDLVQNCIK